jgi:hypothetical protein
MKRRAWPLYYFSQSALLLTIFSVSIVGALVTYPLRCRISRYEWRPDSIQGVILRAEANIQDSSRENENDRVRDVTFASPLLDYGYPPTVEEHENNTLSEKPLFLYLPGFDGTYICPFIQFPELADEFDVRCMTIGMKDRSTFDELKKGVLDFILNELQQEEPTSLPLPSTSNQAEINYDKSPAPKGNFMMNLRLFNRPTTRRKNLSKRPIYLAGESFGGILASEVALTLLKEQRSLSSNLKGLVLINSATCYDRSQLASMGPPIANLPGIFYPFGLSGILPLFMDEYSFPQLIKILQAKALPSVIDNAMREGRIMRPRGKSVCSKRTTDF